MWEPIDASEWRSVPFIQGRLAAEADVRAGRAVFFLEGAHAPEAEPLPMSLPALAVWRSETDGALVGVAIQAERSFGKRLVGLRLIEGGNAVCHIEELEWIDEADPRVRKAT